MNKLMLVCVAALLALTVSGTAAAQDETGDAPIVIVLSWDGMRHDFPDRGELPALDRVAREGVRAKRLTPVFPSSTFPGHVSMATGTYPDRHGIVDNASQILKYPFLFFDGRPYPFIHRYAPKIGAPSQSRPFEISIQRPVENTSRLVNADGRPGIRPRDGT